MFGLITDLMAAMSADTGFGLAWMRARHTRNGHGKSRLVEKLRSERHPHTDTEYIYTVNIMRCSDCGLTYNDCGLEHRPLQNPNKAVN